VIVSNSGSIYLVGFETRLVVGDDAVIGGDFTDRLCSGFDRTAVSERESVTPDVADSLLCGRPRQAEADVDVGGARQPTMQLALVEPLSVLVEEHQYNWFETELGTFRVFVPAEPVGIDIEIRNDTRDMVVDMAEILSLFLDVFDDFSTEIGV
jgi:hypothetical protein